MSLVSYADSDDSGEEEVGESEVKTNVEKIGDKAVKIDKTSLQTKASLERNKPQQEVIDTSGSDTTKPKSIGSLFSSLPAPWMSTVTWANKTSGKKAGKEQTVKITLPTVADNSDSDDEDYVRKNVTPASSERPSRLFSLLPKPKHSVVVKENNPNRPIAKIANRPLIPDSLRRKQTKKSKPQVKKPATKDDGSDDDSDDDGGSFFSLDEPKIDYNAPTTSDVGSTIISDESGEHSNTVPKKADDIVLSMKITATNDAIRTIQETKNVENIPIFSQEVSTSESKYFENQNDYNRQGYPYQGTSDTMQYSGIYQTNSENVGYAQPNDPYYDYYNSAQYNQATTEQERSYPVCPAPAQTNVEETPEQFKRFLGKRGRGEEQIDIIDVNADDQVGSKEWKSNYQKEEADYKPQSKKKDNLPSSQQRRKHQITYLAFQAKEKEWELRNQWSANRQSRRQTQSKYGF